MSTPALFPLPLGLLVPISLPVTQKPPSPGPLARLRWTARLRLGTFRLRVLARSARFAREGERIMLL